MLEKKLGWSPEITAQEMCEEMVATDLLEAKKVKLLKDHGHKVRHSTGE